MRTARAGDDEDGYSEALLGIDEEGWFPLRIGTSDFEPAVVACGSGPGGTARGDSVPTRAEAPENHSEGSQLGGPAGSIRNSDCLRE